MRNIRIWLIIFILVLKPVKDAVADEGMWLWMFLHQNYNEMKAQGLELTPEQIYSVNNSSLKDAVVSLQFCTAEIVSPKGLMFTNHHCAYSIIQSHSNEENNYLDDGFWAKAPGDELPAEGVTASILVRMEDVTGRVLEGVDSETPGEKRSEMISDEIREIESEAVESTFYDAHVRSMYNGNQYILFIYETFPDVRLVGAPPSSIGKYGGDVDNWEWPRHTGDFAVLRIYMSPEGEPAAYSEENIPYQPRHFLPISLEGVEEDGYSMTMGFPGRTQRYLTSYGVDLAEEVSNPSVVDIRDKRLELMKEEMAKNEEVRIQYASKYSRVSNYWKYYIGQNEGLERLNTADLKRDEEEAFRKWAGMEEERSDKYMYVLDSISGAFADKREYEKYYQYLVEGVFGVEIMNHALGYRALEQVLSQEEPEDEMIAKVADGLREEAKAYYKDYYQPLDQKMMAAMMEKFVNNVPADQLPPFMKKLKRKYDGKWDKYARKIFRKSFLASPEDEMEFLEDPSLRKLRKDPAFELMKDLLNHYYENVYPVRRKVNQTISKNMRIYISGLMEQYPDRIFYPDANSTPRLSYGTIQPYEPRDGVKYKYYTTMQGIMEKEDPGPDELNPFQVPARLKSLYEQKDFGPYGDSILVVNFISNNDITGGNSGSPVMNGKGELIGIAFDGNWEAMTGDLDFEESLQRTISVDIRYVLFIIDKFAGSEYIMNELTITNRENP